MKRDLVNEIALIKSRTDFNSRHHFITKLNDIEHGFQEVSDCNLNAELLKYIPIATVACFEAFFRSTYKELIDFGKPFNENVVKFNQSKNVKFDFDIVNSIQTKTLTVGEFISHILPCNNYKDINSNLSILIGKDFTDGIKKFDKESIFEDNNNVTKAFIENSSQIISDLKRTFELRHIFCHEFGSNINVDRDEISRLFSNAKLFLNQTNKFIAELIYPNSPETQADMNIRASGNFEIVEDELSQLVDLIKRIKGDDLGFSNKLFDKTLDIWKTYRKNKAELDASFVEGGTMYPVVYSGSLINTTKEKIESIKNEYKMDLKRESNK